MDAPTTARTMNQPAGDSSTGGEVGGPSGRTNRSETLIDRLEDHPTRSSGLYRLAALAGGALLLGAAVKKRSRGGIALASTAALPLAYRGVTGRWPLPRRMQASSVVVTTRLVIWRPPLDVYQAWRAFDRLPAILRHVERVDVLDERRTRWEARVPGGARVEWEAEITADRPGEALAWRSVDGSPLQQLGSLHFDRWRDEATLLRADLRLLPPAGAAGVAVTALLRPVLEREVHEDLRRFKQLLEAGELPTTAGQSHGERGRFDHQS
jgi:uncharacterized membrane protein